jgi:hypothetical protein
MLGPKAISFEEEDETHGLPAVRLRLGAGHQRKKMGGHGPGGKGVEEGAPVHEIVLLENCYFHIVFIAMPAIAGLKKSDRGNFATI